MSKEKLKLIVKVKVRDIITHHVDKKRVIIDIHLKP